MPHHRTPTSNPASTFRGVATTGILCLCSVLTFACSESSGVDALQPVVSVRADTVFVTAAADSDGTVGTIPVNVVNPDSRSLFVFTTCGIPFGLEMQAEGEWSGVLPDGGCLAGASPQEIPADSNRDFELELATDQTLESGKYRVVIDLMSWRSDPQSLLDPGPLPAEARTSGSFFLRVNPAG